MDAVRTEFGRKETLGNDFVEEFGGAVSGDRIEGSAEDVIFGVFAGDSFTEEAFDRNIVEKIREQIKTAFDETETIEDHCFDGLGMAEVMLTGLGNGGIDHIGDLKGGVGTGDDAEMAEGED